MTPNDWAELFSMFLTVPTLALAAIVVCVWFRQFWAALLVPASSKTAANWFILGVTVSFAGSFCDNLYWAIPWSLQYVGLSASDWWHQNGVWANIPFRQVAGILAGYCHLRAYTKHLKEEGVDGTNWRLSLATGTSFLLGLIYAAWLFLMRGRP